MENGIVSALICISIHPSDDGQVLIEWIADGDKQSRYFHANRIGNPVTLESCDSFLRKIGFLPPLQTV
jgi:hypothetical protein